jgi:hypothetical protein
LVGGKLEAARAFNVNDLDAVMTYFSEDAVYRPGAEKSTVARQPSARRSSRSSRARTARCASTSTTA